MVGMCEWVSVEVPGEHDLRGRQRTEHHQGSSSSQGSSPQAPHDACDIHHIDERPTSLPLDTAHTQGSPAAASLGGPTLWTRTMNGVVSRYYSLKTSASWFLNTHHTGLERLARDKPIWVLGQWHMRTHIETGPGPTQEHPVINNDRVDEGGDEDLLRHLHTVLWFTYRKDFPQIAGSWQTSDCGWGCMLRTSQMILAQTLIRHELGEKWREGDGREAEYKKIISYFADSPYAPCSVHAIAIAGERFDTRIGNWFGPTTAAFALQDVVHRNVALYQRGIRVYVASQTTVFIDRVEELCTSQTPPLRRDRDAVIGNAGDASSRGWSSALILIPLMLGADRQMNERYCDPILKCFQMSQCVGIVGGQPRSSLFFIGHQGTDVLYLDPHAVQAAFNPSQPNSQGRVHETTLHLVPVSQLDPCCVLGFYCRDRQSFDNWVGLVRGSVATGDASLFTVQDRDTFGMGKLDGTF